MIRVSSGTFISKVPIPHGSFIHFNQVKKWCWLRPVNIASYQLVYTLPVTDFLQPNLSSFMRLWLRKEKKEKKKKNLYCCQSKQLSGKEPKPKSKAFLKVKGSPERSVEALSKSGVLQEAVITRSVVPLWLLTCKKYYTQACASR